MTAVWVSEKYSTAADLARERFGGTASHFSPVIETKRGVCLLDRTEHLVEPGTTEVYDAAYRSLHRQAGVRTLAFRNVAVLAAEASGYADIGYADIMADILTIEPCPLLYPSDRADYAFCPAVQTGGLSEAVILLPILRSILESLIG
jgi:hypothetical protein